METWEDGHYGQSVLHGRNGNALRFVEEMTNSGTAAAIRAEAGNLRYEYYQSLDDPETVLLIDSWENQEAIDIHHATPMMATIAALREKYDLHMTVGASVVSCRRGGNSATFEIMNQFFGINGMPTVPSTYWNDVHGYKGEDVLADVEGCETIRNMAANMAFMIKSIRAGKEHFGKPDVKHTQFFNFIR